MATDRSTRSQVWLLHRGELGVAERNLRKIVEFLGGAVQSVELDDASAERRQVIPVPSKGVGCVLVNVSTLSRLGAGFGGGDEARMRNPLAESGANVLVYGFDSSERSRELLRHLTCGSLTHVEATLPGTCQIRVLPGAADVCRQMVNLTFEATRSRVAFAFAGDGLRDASIPLLSTGHGPFFVRVKNGDCEWYLLAGEEFEDLDAPVPCGTSPLEFFPGVAPVMMFLRYSAPEAFWHNEAPAASFIVDDPLLRSRYGFLNYQTLLGLMKRQSFSTSIAFIPWNYRRSDQNVAKLFASHPREYSLCVHGCDHNWAEFGSKNPQLLAYKGWLALNRMEGHQQLTGLGFDDVMVFPQGIFSQAAMAALKDCGYLAAINSTPYPNGEETGLLLRDLLGVAVTRFADFPLFTRWYPRQQAELAFDLFLGKPAILVEHHGFFRNGYDALADTVERLRLAEPRLEWMNPAKLCSQACWKRTAANGDREVLIHTDRFELRNDTGRRQQHVLFRNGLGESASAELTINGRRENISRERTGMLARLTLDAGESAQIRIVNGAQSRPLSRLVVAPPMDRARIVARRYLSEFRDNYIDRSPFLSKSAASFRRMLKRIQMKHKIAVKS